MSVGVAEITGAVVASEGERRWRCRRGGKGMTSSWAWRGDPTTLDFWCIHGTATVVAPVTAQACKHGLGQEKRASERTALTEGGPEACFASTRRYRRVHATNTGSSFLGNRDVA